MKQELCEKLRSEFPKLFSTEYGDPECGDGWYKIIHRLCFHLQKRIDNNPHLNIPQPTIEQIKEKFGSLRFYASGLDEYAWGAIGVIESLSWQVCEYCGSMQNIKHSKGWITTACEDCIATDNHLKKKEWNA